MKKLLTAVAVMLVSVLCGCATQYQHVPHATEVKTQAQIEASGYWKKTSEPCKYTNYFAVPNVHENPFIAAYVDRDHDRETGKFNGSCAVVYSTRLSGPLKRCILDHERMHEEGYDHPGWHHSLECSDPLSAIPFYGSGSGSLYGR